MDISTHLQVETRWLLTFGLQSRYFTFKEGKELE
jgi:hypothetical protein